MQFIVFGILLLTVFAIYFEARRRVAKHQQDIAEEKSEIAEETRMTAQMAVFSAPNDGTYVVAASEEMGAFYYRLLQRGKETVRVKLNLANVLNADLLINGTIQTVEAESGQTSLSNRASEVTALLLSHYPPEIVRGIADRWAQGRLLAVLEGGKGNYMAYCILRVIEAMSGESTSVKDPVQGLLARDEVRPDDAAAIEAVKSVQRAYWKL